MFICCKEASDKGSSSNDGNNKLGGAMDLVWVFGYGSLVWKVGFEHERRLEGFIEGYKRR